MKKLIILLLLPVLAAGQELPEAVTRKIDSAFRAYTPTTPGCALAVMRNGQVIYQKGYGLANMEYGIPITPATIFHIASESKQYVAFCMLLLEKEGKLSLDDDIRKHLPYVPDFGHKITIRHLVHHTSGLRDQWQLLANAGWQLDDVITQDHVIKLVSKQKALNSLPGEEYNYCNTGYTLMAEIVKKVSGLTLREYTDKHIFQPLGMKDTHFHDNYQEIVRNRAYSYLAHPTRGYQHAVLSYSIVGATSLFTTVLDELKWLRNYETGAVGGKDLIEKMYTTGVLNDGRKLNYAFAIAIDQYNGWKRIGHGGADAGFRTYATRFPEHDLSIVVFSNFGNMSPIELANKVADALLPAPRPAAEEVQRTFMDSSFHKKFKGSYYTEQGDLRTIVWEKDGLLRREPNFTEKWEFYLDSVGTYRTRDGLELSSIVTNKQGDSVVSFILKNQSRAFNFLRKPATSQKITDEFAGRYYNDETEASYTVTEKEGALSMEHRKFNTVPMKNIAPDQFGVPYWWMSHIRFLRDKKGKVIAFEVNAGRIQRLRYNKVN
jgi:CubicO group peptidase (beta-lactamase class C family)